MDLKLVKDVLKDSSGRIQESKETLSSDEKTRPQTDSSTALQLFLDRIPISSIPGIRNSPVLELKTGDRVRDAIHLLYEKDIFGAPVADISDPSKGQSKFSDRYIGFIDFATLVLPCLEEYDEKVRHNSIENGNKEGNSSDIFSIVDRISRISKTKVEELATSFLLEPFFPVHLDDTLLHVLLLFSNHRLQVLNVVEPSTSQVIGFVTQNAVIQLLLQSSGLEWFDTITEKALSKFRFENEDHIVYVFGDQTIADTLQVLWKEKIGAVAVVERRTRKLIGSVRNSDVYHILENGCLKDIKTMTAEEFIHIESDRGHSDPTIERDLGALISAGALRLKNRFLPRMDSPVTNKRSDTLQQVMNQMAETKSSFSFLINDKQQPTGLLTSRDIIIQFAPPGVDSKITVGGFFDSALQQAGCRVKSGSIICNH